MKSKLYNRYYASKKEFPTVQGTKGGTVGHKNARRSIEQKLGRPLYEGTTIDSSGTKMGGFGCWVFREPKQKPSEDKG